MSSISRTEGEYDHSQLRPRTKLGNPTVAQCAAQCDLLEARYARPHNRMGFALAACSRVFWRAIFAAFALGWSLSALA